MNRKFKSAQLGSPKESSDLRSDATRADSSPVARHMLITSISKELSNYLTTVQPRFRLYNDKGLLQQQRCQYIIRKQDQYTTSDNGLGARSSDFKRASLHVITEIGRHT